MPAMTTKAKQMGLKTFQNFKIVTSCSNDPAERKQQGGTCMALVNHIVERHVQRGEDTPGLGQWNYIVVADPGDSTVTAQHKQLLTMQGVKNANPWKQWDKDFLATIQKWKEGRYKVLFMGDLNGSIEDANISKMLASTELYDIMRSHHGINNPKTFINGSHAIDMILADKE
eukprot:14279629-Ditylum_brightwellii.AAC.1